MFNLNRINKRPTQESNIDVPPLRLYTSDVVDYYTMAMSSDDAYIQFISFYHVIEYFYDEVFKRRMVEDIQNKITHPDFSYSNADKVYSLATFVRNRMKMNDEAGQGNEEQSLKFVLSEYINLDELEYRLSVLDPSIVDYYKNNKVPFSKAPVFSFKDTQAVMSNIAKRIYVTRNSLVHSKSNSNNGRYKPYKDEKSLSKEIPLLRAIAEQIIIKSSKLL